MAGSSVNLPLFQKTLNDAMENFKARRLDIAEKLCRQCLAIFPGHPGTVHLLAITQFESGQLKQALNNFDRALKITPNAPDILNNKGLALKKLDRLKEAEVCFRRSLSINPNNPEALNNLGNTYATLGKTDDARDCFEKALGFAPNHPGAYNNLGTLYVEQYELTEASNYFRRAIALNPNFLEALNNLGKVLVDLGKYDEAMACLQHVLKLMPDSAEAFESLADLHIIKKQFDQAIACLTEILKINPETWKSLSALVYIQLGLCRWTGLDGLETRLLAAVRRQPKDIIPLHLYYIDASETDLLACTRDFGTKFGTFANVQRPPYSPTPDGRIRIGYISSDYSEHPVSVLMAELIERHDRTRFHVTGYCLGKDDGSALRQRLIAGFDRFVVLGQARPEGAMTHRHAAERIHQDGIDILIDLNGYTAGCRPQILAQRPAPIQINFLGYPGTMGVDFIDYILADAITIPPGHDRFYQEKVVRLPNCLLPIDTKRQISEPLSRKDYGLPDDGVVFCCFNIAQKINPALFDIWMRLLHDVEGSVLWMAHINDESQSNRQNEAKARGIDPDRLVFAPRLPSLADHLARYHHVDLFLDTLPYNGHTTISDALWGGAPVLTCLGKTFAGRVGASLLTAIGLQELVCATLEDYHFIALQLANDRARLAALKTRLLNSRDTAPLFNMECYTANLEAALVKIIQDRSRK